MFEIFIMRSNCGNNYICDVFIVGEIEIYKVFFIIFYYRDDCFIVKVDYLIQI